MYPTAVRTQSRRIESGKSNAVKVPVLESLSVRPIIRQKIARMAFLEIALVALITKFGHPCWAQELITCDVEGGLKA